MLNLNYNINKAIGGGGCIGVMKYNYSASILLAGGGAGIPALTASQARGGGGAGFVWTGSLSVIPNTTYQIYVAQTSSFGGDGNQSRFVGFDDNDTIPFDLIAYGGKIQTPGNFGLYNGGAGGSGSLSREGIVTNYAGFVGGTTDAGSRGGTSQYAGGGGAGVRGNGGNGNINFPEGARGGAGGPGFDASDFGVGGGPVTGIIGVGGAGESIGSFGGQTLISPSAFSQGASIIYNDSAARTGSFGGCVIKYAGKPKAEITNGTTTYSNGFTYHTFNIGTGSFRYTVPYPYEEPVSPYQVVLCPPTYQ